MLVNFFSVLVITRNQSDVYGQNLVEIDPRSLPRLSKQLRDRNNSQKTAKTELQNIETIRQIERVLNFERIWPEFLASDQKRGED